MNKIGFFITSVIVALALGSSMLFVVDQRQYGVVFQLGQIKQVVTEPGLNFKMPPPFQNVSYIDKRLSRWKAWTPIRCSRQRSSAW